MDKTMERFAEERKQELDADDSSPSSVTSRFGSPPTLLISTQQDTDRRPKKKKKTTDCTRTDRRRWFNFLRLAEHKLVTASMKTA